MRLIEEMIFTAKRSARKGPSGCGSAIMSCRASVWRLTYELAYEITANAPLSIAVMKEQLRILADAASMSPQGFERIEGLRRVVYDGEDYPGGIRAFKEKRQ